MSRNIARRFSKILYEGPQGDEIIGKANVSSEEHTINRKLRNLVSNVEFIAILPGVPQLNADSNIMDGKLSKALEEHLMLEQRLEMLEDHSLSEGKNKTIQLEKKIKTSFRNLLRLLKYHPLLLLAWKIKLEKEKGICERALNIFRGLEPKRQLTAAKPLPASSDLKGNALLQDAPATIEEVTTKISQKRQEIDSLQSTLKKKREEESVLEEQLKISIKESETMQNKLQQEVDHMRAQVDDVLDQNFEEAAALRQKIKRVDSVTEHFIDTFDEEMEALQASVDLNAMKYEQEVEEVKKLEMLYVELDAEYSYILEKRWLVKEKKESEWKELALKTEASLLVQAWWRGYCVRKTLKEGEKKANVKRAKKRESLKEKRETIGKGQKDTKVKGKASGKETV